MTAPVTYMDYERVGTLAARVAEAAAAVADGQQAVGGSPSTYRRIPAAHVPPWNAFGNTPTAAALAGTYARTRHAASTAAGNLTLVLDQDVSRLREVIRCFQETDHETADRLCAAAGQGTLTVYSAHVHSHGSDDATADDIIRAGQIGVLADRFNARPGVLGADLNVEADQDNRSAQAVRDFVDDGHVIDAGEVGGTSSGGRSIDYVITSPAIDAANPQRVEGDPSDHDGQRVDLTIPRW